MDSIFGLVGDRYSTTTTIIILLLLLIIISYAILAADASAVRYDIT